MKESQFEKKAYRYISDLYGNTPMVIAFESLKNQIAEIYPEAVLRVRGNEIIDEDGELVAVAIE